MNIRPATSADCAALAAIDRAGNPAPWSAAQFQTALNSRFDTVLLAEHQGRSAAFIVWQTVADESELHLIATAPESRRLGLAAAMYHDPTLIVLDEPSNALDPASVLLLREQLTRRAADGAAILVSSHRLDEVSRIADRVLLLNAGRLIGQLDTSGADLERAFFERIREDDGLRAPAEVAT